MVDATSTSAIREGANLIVAALATAVLFTLQQPRMISGKQSNLLLAPNNATQLIILRIEYIFKERLGRRYFHRRDRRNAYSGISVLDRCVAQDAV
jgi:hypothetical protein